MICISLGKMDFHEAMDHCRKEEMVEIRADLMKPDAEQLTQLFSVGAEIIFTCRKLKNTVEERLKLYRIALENQVAWVDLDMNEDIDIYPGLIEEIKKSESKLILSYHNFEFTPEKEDLNGILREMRSKDADLAKIACMVNSDEDTARLLGLYRKPGNKLILGMGEKGMITRIAAMFMGAPFTFASPEGGEKTAPGQLTGKELREILSIMKG